jgi:hypothetical protein
MDIRKQIQSLLNEAAVYDAQGLYEESREKYVHIANTIKRHAHIIDKHKELLNSVSNRLKRLKTKLQRLENEPIAYQMPNIVLEVMKRHFSSSQDKDQAALEGALALAEFRQYESALEELTKLLKNRSTRLEASKNIIRCHLAKGRASEAVNLYRHWRNSGLMGPDEMAELRLFFQNMSDSHELHLELPSAEVKNPGVKQDVRRPPRIKNRHVIDFSSISVRLPNGPRRQGLREFDIISQSGDVVNVLIPDHDKKTVEGLGKGTLLDPVQCFSTNAMFSGKATVVGNTQILSGDNAGHFSIDIKIQGI